MSILSKVVCDLGLKSKQRKRRSNAKKSKTKRRTPPRKANGEFRKRR
jgi:hypothetical protein